MSGELIGVAVGGLIAAGAGVLAAWISGRFALRQIQVAQQAKDKAAAYK